MQLRRYLDSLTPREKEDFAVRCGSTISTLTRIASGLDPSSPQAAVRIDKASGGKVHYRSVIRPYEKRVGRVKKPMDWGYVERRARETAA